MNAAFDFAQVLAALADLPTEQQVSVIEDTVGASTLAKEAPLMSLLVMDFDTNHMGLKLEPELEFRMEVVRKKIRNAVRTCLDPCDHIPVRSLPLFKARYVMQHLFDVPITQAIS